MHLNELQKKVILMGYRDLKLIILYRFTPRISW